MDDWGQLACTINLCDEMTEMTEMRFEVQFEKNAGGFEVRPSAGWDVWPLVVIMLFETDTLPVFMFLLDIPEAGGHSSCFVNTLDL